MKKMLIIFFLIISIVNKKAFAAIKIPFFIDLSGPTCTLIYPYYIAVRNYFDNLNDMGGIKGEKVQLMIYDTAYEPLKALNYFNKIKKRKDIGVILGWGTGSSLKLAPLVKTAKIVLIPGSFSEQLVTPLNPYVFIQASSYTDEFLALLKYAKKHPKKRNRPVRVAFVYNSSPFGVTPIKPAEIMAKKLGVEVVAKEIVELNASEAKAQMVRIKEKEPDYILIQETIQATCTVVKSGHDVGLKDVTYMGTYYCGDKKLIKLLGLLAEKVIFVTPFSRWIDVSAGVKVEVDNLFKKYNNTESENDYLYYLQGYNISSILYQALKNAKGYSGKDIKYALENTRFDTKGLTSTFEYTSTSHKPTKKVKFYQVQKGEFKLITDWQDI